MKLIMVGHYAGKNVTINGFKFENGEVDIGDDLKAADGIVRYFSFYNAYLAGSKELALAQKHYEESKEVANGQDANLGGEGSDTGGTQANVSGTAEGASGAGNAGTEADGAGAVPAGDGSSEGRVVSFSPPESSDAQVLKIIDALKMLNPENDEFWTDAGLPKVSAVEEASGIVGVTRKDIVAAYPDFNRELAMAVMLNSL
jgi:hypothetical protein